MSLLGREHGEIYLRKRKLLSLSLSLRFYLYLTLRHFKKKRFGCRVKLEIYIWLTRRRIFVEGLFSELTLGYVRLDSFGEIRCR